MLELYALPVRKLFPKPILNDSNCRVGQAPSKGGRTQGLTCFLEWPNFTHPSVRGTWNTFFLHAGLDLVSAAANIWRGSKQMHLALNWELKSLESKLHKLII